MCYSTNNKTTTISKGLGLSNAPEECVHSWKDMSDYTQPPIFLILNK